MYQRDPWKTLHNQIRNTCQSDDLYKTLSKYDCGAFDGGCLMVASALQNCIGDGQVMALYGTQKVSLQLTEHNSSPLLIPHHALLYWQGYYLDGDGIQSYMNLILGWQTNYNITVKGIHPLTNITTMTRCGIPYDVCTISTLAALFERRLSALKSIR